MRIGVICPSEIALRRFMPALKKIDDAVFVGVGLASRQERQGIDDEQYKDFEYKRNRQYEKANKFINEYGGEIFESYENVVTSDKIDAIYIPLPPALHYKWAKKALENGKHVLLEKPFTVSLADTVSLVKIAGNRDLALHENYMFAFHSQMNYIEQVISSGEIGDIRLFRLSFGFPMRESNDFRYNRELGGGALLDAGGYTMKYAAMLLGDSAKVVYSNLNSIAGLDVDMYGSGVMVNDKGTVAQLAFGMDNDYKCELEVWGSRGTLYTNRVLTAPVGYNPTIIISKNGIRKEIKLEADDTFEKSIHHFLNCIVDKNLRYENYSAIIKQARNVERFKELSLDSADKMIN